MFVGIGLQQLGENLGAFLGLCPHPRVSRVNHTDFDIARIFLVQFLSQGDRFVELLADAIRV